VLESGVVSGEIAVADAASEVVESFLHRNSPGEGVKKREKAK